MCIRDRFRSWWGSSAALVACGAFGPSEWCLSASVSCKRSLVMEHLPVTGLDAAPQRSAIRSPSAVLGDVLQHHEALGKQPAAHVLHKDRFAVRVRLFSDTCGHPLVADLAPRGAELMKVGRKKPFKAGSVGAALR